VPLFGFWSKDSEMNILLNMKIGTRLALAFASLVALLLGMTGVGISRISAVNASTEVIVQDRLVKIALAHTIENEVNRQSRAVRTALIATDPLVVQSELSKVEQSGPVVAEAFDSLMATVHTEQGKAALSALGDARRAFKADEHKLVEMIRANHIEEGRSYLIKEMMGPQTAYLHAIEGFADTQAQGMKHFAAEAAEMAQGAVTLMGVLSGLAVASEVRSLAGRSADAAKEIKNLIGASVSRVEHGTNLVDQAGVTMIDVVNAIRRVTDIVAEISAASAEQSSGVSQVGEAVTEMDRATQQNAALVEESAAAAESLKRQAEQLVQALSGFRLAS
jgi:methyl-accepting chemotaxis protein